MTGIQISKQGNYYSVFFQSGGFLKFKWFLFSLCLFVMINTGCEEKLPVRIEPENVAEVFLEMTEDQLVIFKPGIRNIFDETFDDNPFINGNIYIWLESGKFIKELPFHLEDIRVLTVDIQQIAWTYKYWDLTDSEGYEIWKYGNNLNLKAVAKIKFYKRIPSLYSDTLSFTLKKEETK